MAVTAIPLSSKLQLHVRIGYTDEGKAILRTRSYANLKPAASDQDLYDTGMEMSELQDHYLEVIRRVDETELEEE